MTQENRPISQLLEKIQAIESRADALTAGLNDPSFAWSPEPGRWSVGECLEHLNLTAQAFLPLLDRAIDNGVPTQEPAAAIRPGLLGRGFIYILEPPTKGRVNAPKSVRPPRELSMTTVTTRFNDAHKELADRVRRAQSIELNRTKMRHPAIPVVRFSVGEIFEIVLAHERRHLWQAEKVRRQPGFPLSP
jgi:hypothetical protein